jgi:hypothetical protein
MDQRYRHLVKFFRLNLWCTEQKTSEKTNWYLTATTTRILCAQAGQVRLICD